MSVELFAGLPVSDRARSIAWFAQLLGAEPSFFPNDTEAVWELLDHGYLYVDVRPEHAGSGMVTLFVDDFEENLPPAIELGMSVFLHDPGDPARTVAELERRFGVSLAAG